MRITFLTPELGLHGGNICMLKYAEFFVVKGHSVTIITNDKRNDFIIDPRIKIVKYKAFPIKLIDFFSFQLVYFIKIYKLISDTDVIIPIYTPLLLPAIFARNIKLPSAKITLFFQDCFEMIWVGRFIKLMLGIKTVTKNINSAISVSKGLAVQFEKNTGLKPEVIPNGIDRTAFYDRRLQKEFYLLFVGRPNRPKGFHTFISAYLRARKLYPALKAIVVSPGVKEREENGVCFRKHTTKEKLAEHYSKALIYVSTSLAESFGLPPLEAMASNTAVVMTRTMGSLEYAVNRKNCLLVSVNNSKETAQAIISLIKNRKLREALQREGLKTADKYSWALSLEKFEKHLSDVACSMRSKIENY